MSVRVLSFRVCRAAQAAAAGAYSRVWGCMLYFRVCRAAAVTLSDPCLCFPFLEPRLPMCICTQRGMIAFSLA